MRFKSDFTLPGLYRLFPGSLEQISCVHSLGPCGPCAAQYEFCLPYRAHRILTLGPWFHINLSFYRYRKSRCRYKTVVRLSYLYNVISYTGQRASLYWISTLVLHGSIGVNILTSFEVLFSRSAPSSVPNHLMYYREYRPQCNKIIWKETTAQHSRSANNGTACCLPMSTGERHSVYQ